MESFIGHFYCEETLNEMDFKVSKTKTYDDSFYVMNDE